MKATRLRWFLLFLLAIDVCQLPAQQSEADSTLLADIRAKAEKGDAQSQFELGKAFYLGSHGVVKNDVESAKWYRKAAEQNDAQAQFNLGVCYANGEGVAKDYAEGYKWILLAAGQGSEFAKKALATVEGMMTPEQIAEGQKLARNFRPRQVPASGGR